MGKSFVTVKTFETLLDARCLWRKPLIYKGNMAVFSVFRRPPYKSRKTSYIKEEYLYIWGCVSLCLKYCSSPYVARVCGLDRQRQKTSKRLQVLS